MRRKIRFRFALGEMDKRKLDNLAQRTFRSRVNVMLWLLWSATGGDNGENWAWRAELQDRLLADDLDSQSEPVALTFTVTMSADERTRLTALARRLNLTGSATMRLLLRLAASDLEQSRIGPDALPPLPLHFEGDVEEWGWQQPARPQADWRPVGWEDVL